MSDREELMALRRMAELEAKASGQSNAQPAQAAQPAGAQQNEIPSRWSLGALFSPQEAYKRQKLSDAGRQVAIDAVMTGAADIGNTLLIPDRWALNKLAPKETTTRTLITGEKTRPDSFLGKAADYLDSSPVAAKSFDAQHAGNPLYSGVKLGTQVAMTAPVGGALGEGVAMLAPRLGSAAPTAMKLASSLKSGGTVLGSPAASTLTGKAADMGLRVLGGGLTGGASAGLVDPNQAVNGALYGGVLPPTVLGLGNVAKSVGRGFRKIVQPLNEANDNAILAERLKGVLGDQFDEAGARLQGLNVFPKRPGEGFVPGYKPTAAEVAQVPTLSALQRTTTATNGAAKNEFYRQIAPNNQQAIVSELSDLAGRDGAADFSRAARDATSKKLYGEAYKAGIDPSMLTPEALQNIATFSKRVPDGLLAEARMLAKMHGEDLTDANSLQGMHWVKEGLDSMIAKAIKNDDTSRLAAAVHLKNDLLSGMDELSSAYQLARKTHADMSVPVNQFDTLERIAKTSISPTGEVVHRNAFSRAVNDQTAKSATGFSKATLENTLTPDQLNRLANVRNTLDAIDAAANVGRMPGAHNFEHMASGGLPGSDLSRVASKVPGVNLFTGLLSRGAEGLYSNADQRLMSKLSMGLLDPESTLQIMRELKVPKNQGGLLDRYLPYVAPSTGLLGSRQSGQ